MDLRIGAVLCAFDPPPVWMTVVRHLNEAGLSIVLVVDDGSPQPLRVPAPVEMLRLSENAGLAAARNAAVAALRGRIDWVLFVDADVLPDPLWLATLRDSISQQHHAGVAGIGFSVREHFRSAPWDALRAFERDAVNPERDSDEVEWVSGLLSAYRLSALDAVGGFNPAFRTNGEDVDLGRRLSRAGYKLTQSSALAGEHHRKDTLGTFLRMHRRYAATSRTLERLSPSPRGAGPHGQTSRWSGAWASVRPLVAFACRFPWHAWLLPLTVAAKALGVADARSAARENTRQAPEGAGRKGT